MCIRDRSFNDTLFSTEQNIDGLMAGTYALTLTDNFGCAYGYEFMVERQMSVNTIETVLSNQIRIAPNPSDGLFTIQLNAADDYLRSIQVFSVEGRLLPLERIIGGRRTNTSINLQDYPKGVYLVKVQTEKGIALRKIALF